MSVYKKVRIIRKFFWGYLTSGNIYNIETLKKGIWEDVVLCSSISRFWMRGGLAKNVFMENNFTNPKNFSSKYNVEKSFFKKIRICSISGERIYGGNYRTGTQILPTASTYRISVHSTSSWVVRLDDTFVKSSSSGGLEVFTITTTSDMQVLRLETSSYFVQLLVDMYSTDRFTSETKLSSVYVDASGLSDETTKIQLPIQTKIIQLNFYAHMLSDASWVKSMRGRSISFGGKTIKFDDFSLWGYNGDSGNYVEIASVSIKSDNATDYFNIITPKGSGARAGYVDIKVVYEDTSIIQDITTSNTYGLLSFEE